MQKVAVGTDSCCSLPENLLAELNIHTVAYYIHRGREVLRDLVTVKRDEFLAWLPTAASLPKTACPGPGDYIEMYRSLVENGVREIISIHMTSCGSGAYQSASLAKSMLAESAPEIKLEVVDTKNVSLCQGWIALEAARAALSGASLEAISRQVAAMIPVTRMIQTARPRKDI